MKIILAVRDLRPGDMFKILVGQAVTSFDYDWQNFADSARYVICTIVANDIYPSMSDYGKVEIIAIIHDRVCSPKGYRPMDTVLIDPIVIAKSH